MHEYMVVPIMASWVSSEAKLDAMRCCLQSIKDQSSRKAQSLLLVVSYGAATEALARSARALLDELLPGQPVLQQPVGVAISQFEHYRLAVASLRAQRKSLRCQVWVAFSDDDDLWHPRRLEMMHTAVAQVVADPTVTQVRFPWFATRSEQAPSGSPSGSLSDAAPRAASDVDRLLRTRAARIYNHDATELTESEHWASVSRLELLAAFLDQATPAMVACPFCDLAFERFSHLYAYTADGKPVVEGGEAVTVAWNAQQPWMYYYRVPEGGSMEKQCQAFPSMDGAAGGGHASSSALTPTADDQRLAGAMLPAHTRAFPATRYRSAALLSVKLAHLRRNLCVTICQRLWPLRQLASASQLAEGVIKDVERTFSSAAQAAEDYALLAELKPLRSCLRDFGMGAASEEVADRFERHVRSRCR